MGLLISGLEKLKAASLNENGKVQILPRFSIWLLLILPLSLIPIFYEMPQGGDILLWVFAILSLMIWCFGQVFKPETKLIEYTAWLIMFIIFCVSIYVGYYLIPIVFKL